MASSLSPGRVATGLIGTQLLAALVLLTGAPLGGSSLGGLPLDDSWIHLVYARSFAERLAFEYNRGTLEAGMSSPFWVVVLGSGLRLVGTEFPVAVAKTASMLFAVLGVLGSAWLGGRLAGPLGALLAGLFLVALPEWTYAGLSGMETTAAGAVLVWLACATLAERRWLTVALLTIAPLVRPELLVPVAVLGLAMSRPDRADVVGSARRTLATFLPVSIGIAAWIAYHLVAVGRPLPNTFYVKVDRPLTAIGDAVLMLPDLWIEPLASGSMLGYLFLILAVGLGAQFAFRRGKASTLLWGTALLFLLGVVTVAPQAIGGSNHYFRRYYDPALPLLAAFAAAGAMDVVRLAGRSLHPRTRRLLLVTGALFVGISVPPAWRLSQSEYASQTLAIYRIDITLSRWLATNVPPGSRIATYEAGATKWHLPDHEVIDINGLNTAGAVRLPLVPLIAKYRPDYLATWTDPAIDALPQVESAMVRIGFDDVPGVTPQEVTVWKLRAQSDESTLRAPSGDWETRWTPRE